MLNIILLCYYIVIIPLANGAINNCHNH